MRMPWRKPRPNQDDDGDDERSPLGGKGVGSDGRSETDETRNMSMEHVGLWREEGKDGTKSPSASSGSSAPQKFKNLVRGRGKEGGGDGTWQRISFILTGLFYFLGALCLLLYAAYIMQQSPTLGAMHTVIPVLLHLVGTGATVAIKVYFDWRKDVVGHLESMHLIVRSRLWLFPGLTGKLEEVTRSAAEEDLAINHEGYKPIPLREDENDPIDDGEFNVVGFLKRCHLPEFRCLFRAFERYNWGGIADMENVERKDELVNLCQEDIQRIFPAVDMLDCGGSIPRMLNPFNYLRLLRRAKHLALRNTAYFSPDAQEPSIYGAQRFRELDEAGDRTITRGEEIEVDDRLSDADRKVKYYKRSEPRPWGTLRIRDCEARYKAMERRLNLMSALMFSMLFGGYLMLIFGETHFYSRLDYAKRHSSSSGVDGSSEDDYAWSMEYDGLHAFAPLGVLLLWLVLPFALQASALITENMVVPILVVDTVRAHVENFTKELDEYLTVLACNKGLLESKTAEENGFSVPHATPRGRRQTRQSQAGDQAGQEHKEKVHRMIKMTRALSFSWRFNKFMKEIEHDSDVINSSVVLMVLNFVCHLIPLNVYVFDYHSCIPIWVVLFTMAQWLGLIMVIWGGIKCNEAINGGIDSLLHTWQLRFNTIALSGGFTKVNEDGEEVGYIVKDPPDETKEHIAKMEETDQDYGTMVQNEQQKRIETIVKMLKHYEDEESTPFSVLGVAVTEQMFWIIFGFFGGQIIAIFSTLIDNKDDIRPQFMCHGWV